MGSNRHENYLGFIVIDVSNVSEEQCYFIICIMVLNVASSDSFS